MIHSDQKSFPKKKYNNVTLENIIKSDAISNAYIFHGPEGIGRTETAFDFISAIIKKSNSNVEPIERIKANNFPDFFLIEPTYLMKGKLIRKSELQEESKQKIKPIIRIDQIREIKKFLGQRSIESDKKFIVIKDAHLLNEAASNCLLKTLEEPENGLFILITSSVNNLLETIKSRCQQIQFKRLSNKELYNQLNSNEKFTKEIQNEITHLKELIYIANGSPKKLWENISIWLSIPEKIKKKIAKPIYNKIDILILVKTITDELNIDQQYFLIDFILYKWWKETYNINTMKFLENLKDNISNNIQPRLAWEVCLLTISLDES
tara:strand:+ start:5967 stop:6932 length:966 start_codon:yes stop_codon:yes gene_type:complete